MQNEPTGGVKLLQNETTDGSITVPDTTEAVRTDDEKAYGWSNIDTE